MARDSTIECKQSEEQNNFAQKVKTIPNLIFNFADPDVHLIKDLVPLQAPRKKIYILLNLVSPQANLTRLKYMNIQTFLRDNKFALKINRLARKKASILQESVGKLKTKQIRWQTLHAQTY